MRIPQNQLLRCLTHADIEAFKDKIHLDELKDKMHLGQLQHPSALLKSRFYHIV